MYLNLATLGPFISLIMMINITNQKVGRRFVNDDPNITIYPNGPKSFIFGKTSGYKTRHNDR